MDHDLVGVTINSRSSTTGKAGEEKLLLDNGAQQHACLVKYPVQRIQLLDLEIHTANGVRLQHDGGRLARFKLSRRQDNPSAFPCVRCQKTILLFGCLAQQEYWSDLRTDTRYAFLS